MNWPLIVSISVNFLWVLLVYVFIHIVTGFFIDPEYDVKKHKIRCFMDRTAEGAVLLLAGLVFVNIFGCAFTGVPLTPSVPGLKKLVMKIEEAGLKQSVEVERTEAGDKSNNIVIPGDSFRTKNTVGDNKAGNNVAKNIVGDNKQGNNKTQNSKSKNSNSDSMADKIKYAKQNNYTFLYNNKKVNEEDFDYKNSDVVVLNDLKLVIGMPK